MSLTEAEIARRRDARANGTLAPLLSVMVRDRGEGKTTDLILWALGGRKTESGHPPFSRVILTTSDSRARDLQRQYPVVREQIHSLSAWQQGRGLSQTIEIALDDAEGILQDAVGGHRLSLVSMTGKTF